MDSTHPTRRQVMKTAAVTAAAAAAFPNVARAQNSNRPLKVGVIGCGGRGTGAAHNAIMADGSTEIIALADIDPGRIDGCIGAIKKDRGKDIPRKNCFVGFDAYKKLLEIDAIDYVILATPPYYRPEHFTACIEAGRHVFTEKPVAVDPPGARKMMKAGKLADQKGLSVAAGTQRRHENKYLAIMDLIHKGAIGDVTGAQCYWNQSQLWARLRQDGWDDMTWMHRDWVNWAWLSGDHIVEQHVHNIDIVNWAIGSHPESVVSMGGRARRETGDQFDFFSNDFIYPGGIHVHSMCRQVNDCANEVNEHIVGQTGTVDCRTATLTNFGKISFEGNDPYTQEHKDLQDAIRSGKRINETQNVAESTLSAIMARTAAYTGKQVTWDEMMTSDMVLEPPTYELTPEHIQAHVPVPGGVWRV